MSGLRRNVETTLLNKLKKNKGYELYPYSEATLDERLGKVLAIGHQFRQLPHRGDNYK